MKRILIFVCMMVFFVALISPQHAKAARFVNNNDGTITDTQTNLMWADKDNGGDINWVNAKSYCEGYNGSGKSGWRMPTMEELLQLYNSSAYGSLIKRTGSYVWSSETSGSDAASVFFYSGNRSWARQSSGSNNRALPVRSVK